MDEPMDEKDMLGKYNMDLIKKEAITDDDKACFEKIDIIVDTLQEHFKNLTREFIIDALKSNSLNLKNTYQYLKNPETMKGNIYILINLLRINFY
jgi:hypothetical protein